MEIRDAEVCGDMAADGATCFHTLTTDSRDIPKAAWDTEREGMVCTKSENFANWKTALEQLCHETKGCTYKVQKQVEAFFDRVQTYITKAEAK